MGITEQLARFSIETPGEHIDAAVIESSRLRFLDTLGIAVAGSRHQSCLISLDLARHLGGNPQASVIGHRDKTSSPLAGYLNGVAAHAYEFDDYTKSVTHVSVCMVPGTLALAEELGVSGRKLLEAFAIGFQIESQLAHGLRPWLFDRGWHPNGILGAIGVAVAGCRMLGLDLMQTRMAIGIAASEGSGVRKNVGSMGKAFHIGHGVRCGIFAAQLAARGFKVDPDIIEGYDDGGLDGHDRFGLADTFNGIGNWSLEKMQKGLGTEWELAANTTVVRFHPGSTAPAAAIDGMIDLARQHDIRADQVERIELECTPQMASIAAYTEAHDSHKARFCLPYGMAVSLIDRAAGIAQYTDERVNRADVQQLMPRVAVRVPDDFKHHKGQWGEGVNWGEMRLAVILKDGRRLAVARSHARGWSEQPATWDDIAEKYEQCCDGILARPQIDDSMAMIRRIDTLPDVRELMRTLQA